METLTINEKAIVRNTAIAKVAELLDAAEQEVLVVDSNALAIPTTYDGKETAVKIVISVPNGERGGNGWDCYFEAEQYKIEQAEKERKAAEKAKAKAEKIAKDAARRAELAKQKAALEQKKAETAAAEF